MSSRVASRTTRCGESAGGPPLASSCGIAGTTVPTAGAAVGLHHDRLAGPRRGSPAGRRRGYVCARPTGVSLTADERQCGFRRAHSCSTSQSATILTPAFRSSATSARSTAANARTPRSPPIRRRQPLERRPHVGVGQRASVRARSPAASTSRSSDAIARRCDASCSRSLRRRRRSSPAAPWRPRAGAAGRALDGRARSSTRCATSRASTSSPALACERLADAAVGRRRDRARLALAVPARDQRGRDLVGRERPEPQPRAARPHRRQQHVGPRRDQHEDRRRRRLLERLQQRVLRRRRPARPPRR